MTIRILILAALATLAMAGYAFAQSCSFSGAPVTKSGTRMRVVLNNDGTQEEHFFGGPAHAYYYITDVIGPNPDIVEVEVLDYNTRNARTPRMIDGDNAIFLFDADLDVAGTTADPSVIAFSNETTATTWSDRVGGEIVVGFDAVWERLNALRASQGGNVGDRYGHNQRSY